MKFDHKKFVQDVSRITGCDHEQAFEVLGLVVELTQRAHLQGAKSFMQRALNKELGIPADDQGGA